jgi:hypothetical protein
MKELAKKETIKGELKKEMWGGWRERLKKKKQLKKLASVIAEQLER